MKFRTDGGVEYQLGSFQTITRNLSTLSRNLCKIGGRLSDMEFETLSRPSEYQAEMLKRVESLRNRY